MIFRNKRNTEIFNIITYNVRTLCTNEKFKLEEELKTY